MTLVKARLDKTTNHSKYPFTPIKTPRRKPKQKLVPIIKLALGFAFNLLRMTI